MTQQSPYKAINELHLTSVAKLDKYKLEGGDLTLLLHLRDYTETRRLVELINATPENAVEFEFLRGGLAMLEEINSFVRHLLEPVKQTTNAKGESVIESTFAETALGVPRMR